MRAVKQQIYFVVILVAYGQKFFNSLEPLCWCKHSNFFNSVDIALTELVFPNQASISGKSENILLLQNFLSNKQRSQKSKYIKLHTLVYRNIYWSSFYVIHSKFNVFFLFVQIFLKLLYFPYFSISNWFCN